MSRARHDKPSPPAEPPTLEQKIDELHARLVCDKHSELYGVLDILGNKRQLMWLNFLAGLARGVGFFLGVTLVGALLLGGLAFAFNRLVASMGFRDLTFEQAVRQAVIKLEQVEEIVEKTEAEIESGQVALPPLEEPAPAEPPPAPDAPR